MPEPTTQAASSIDAKLAQMEQEVSAQAGEAETNEQLTETKAPESGAPEYGQAFAELAKKKGFKNPDELVRAYQHLESRSTKAEQQASSLQEQLEQVNKMQATPGITDDQQQALAILEQTIERVMAKKLAPIQDTLGVQKVDRMVADMQMIRPDFKGEVVDQTLAYMVDHRGLSMEDAYKIVTFDQHRANSDKQEVRQAKETQKSRAYVESAGSSKTPETDYSKLSLAELEEILPSANDFIDHRGKMRRG